MLCFIFSLPQLSDILHVHVEFHQSLTQESLISTYA